MAHTLSIIIPVYNTSAFLEKCVESVLKQNVEMEIILIDDGSTDDSPGPLRPSGSLRCKDQGHSSGQFRDIFRKKQSSGYLQRQIYNVRGQ